MLSKWTYHVYPGAWTVSFWQRATTTTTLYIRNRNLCHMITQDYIPNLRNVILKRVSYSPIDYESKPTTSIKGTLACGVPLPYQSSWMRPIPQLSSYKIPSLSNVYLCGSGNHPGAGVSMAPGRNAS